MIQVIDKTNGSVFDVDHPDAIDIETAKTFLEDNLFPYFSPKTNWNDYEELIKNKNGIISSRQRSYKYTNAAFFEKLTCIKSVNNNFTYLFIIRYFNYNILK